MKDEQFIPAIILAAGQASRMGLAKQLLTIHGKSLLELAIEKARQATGCPPIVVTGARRDQIEQHLSDQAIHPAHNEDWATGMGSSISAGLSKLNTVYPEASGCLIILADQPLVTASVLKHFLVTFLSEKVPLVVASYNNTHGVPAVFDCQLFPDLIALNDQKGAKKVILAHLSNAFVIPCPAAAQDIDTPDDWEAFQESRHKE